MSSKVRNRKAVNERRVASVLSHEQGFMFVSAEIYVKGCIINAIEGFRITIRIPSSVFSACSAPIKKEKSNAQIYKLKRNYPASVSSYKLIFRVDCSFFFLTNCIVFNISRKMNKIRPVLYLCKHSILLS